MTEASGGKFWIGFAAGALSSIASSAWSGGSTETTGFSKENNWAYGAKTITHAGLGNAGMVAFSTVVGGGAAALTGGNFWVGAATGLSVGLLNHYAHSSDDEGNPPSKYKRYFGDKLNEIKNTLEDYVSQKSYQALRWSFDSAETAGGLMEIGSVTSVLFTGGAATPGAVLVGTIGFYTSAFGTAGNIGMDLYFDKNLKSASYRAFKFAVSAGTGKVLGNYFKGFDGAILDLHAKFYENVVVPNIEQHFNKNYNKF